MTRRSLVVAIGAALLVLAFWVAWRGLERPPQPPQGATPLALRTQPPRWHFPLAPRACPLAGLVPIKPVRDGNALTFESVADQQRVPVVFPNGFAAWLERGRATLVAPEGVVVAREGDILKGLGGASADNGDFLVCFTGPHEYDDVVEP